MIEKPSQALMAAATLIADPDAWCQGTLAESWSPADVEIFAHHPRAIRWCSVGALHKVAVMPRMPLERIVELQGEALASYYREVDASTALAEEAESFLALAWLEAGHESVAEGNDAENTDHALVLDRFQRAAFIAKGVNR